MQEIQASVTWDELPLVTADPGQVVQLFQNFIGNAIKFRGDKPPSVHLGVQRLEHEWLFSVKDNGIGFEERYLDRIFAPFQRLHGRTEYEGTGMGLAICRKIVERHHGTITARSAPGKGSTFIVFLPATPGSNDRH